MLHKQIYYIGGEHSVQDQILIRSEINIKLLNYQIASQKIKFVGSAQQKNIYMDPQQNLSPIEFLICLHVQATCDENSEMKPCQQIIQLSAIAVNVKKQNAEYIGKYHRFVKPQCNPKLTEFCSKITGISNAQLKDQSHAEVVIDDLEKWVKIIDGLKINNFTFVIWGNWTLQSCLLKEIKVKKLKLPDFLHSYIDMKRIFNYHFHQNLNPYQACKFLKIDSKKEENLTKSQLSVGNVAQVATELFNNKKFKPSRKFITTVQDLVNVNVTNELEYLLVLDFEATCEEDVKLKPCSEIIEFPVMVISLKEAKVIDKFHHYVTPSYNPKLTKFCTELTGITQQMVDNKLKLEQVLVQFEKWIESQKYLVAKNFTFVTCGDWDLSNCLAKEAKTKYIELPEYLKNYINIKNVFRQCLPEFNLSMGMMGMLKGLNIPHQGRHHSGIDDVLNICNICIGLMKIKGHKYTKQQIKYVK